MAGLFVTWALHLAGWGKPPGTRPREQWPVRARDRGARDGHAGCLGCRLAGRGRTPGRTDAGTAGTAGTAGPMAVAGTVAEAGENRAVTAAEPQT